MPEEQVAGWLGRSGDGRLTWVEAVAGYCAGWLMLTLATMLLFLEVALALAIRDVLGSRPDRAVAGLLLAACLGVWGAFGRIVWLSACQPRWSDAPGQRAQSRRAWAAVFLGLPLVASPTVFSYAYLVVTGGGDDLLLLGALWVMFVGPFALLAGLAFCGYRPAWVPCKLPLSPETGRRCARADAYGLYVGYLMARRIPWWSVEETERSRRLLRVKHARGAVQIDLDGPGGQQVAKALRMVLVVKRQGRLLPGQPVEPDDIPDTALSLAEPGDGEVREDRGLSRAEEA